MTDVAYCVSEYTSHFLQLRDQNYLHLFLTGTCVRAQIHSSLARDYSAFLPSEKMPLDTILLLDTSGSMAGRGITELKRACNTFLDGVEETARQTGLKVYF